MTNLKTVFNKLILRISLPIPAILSGIFILMPLRFSQAQIHQQNCSGDRLEVDVSGKAINWEQFPDFSLPLPVVYHGAVPADKQPHPLRKGFSHIQGSVKSYTEKIPFSNRVYLWTGIAAADNWAKRTKQPWVLIKSPWGNDIEGYRQRWWNRLVHIKANWDTQRDIKEQDFDMIIADIEMARHSDKDILAIKDHSLVPKEYQRLSDREFIAAYQQSMRELYNEPLKLIRDSLSSDIKISSYGDTPIRRDWWGIGSEKYSQGFKEASLTDFLVKDNQEQLNSGFYNNLDFISPTAYYFYDPAKDPTGRNYLSYLLFQIEANKAVDDKSQMLFVWTNYHNSASPKMDPVSPEMAEASAIFPLISGVGIYNWRMNNNQKGNYEFFIRGLYRMSKFNGFFKGDPIYVVPESASSSFRSKNAVWRGLVNDGKILIAAHNPHAKANETTQVKVAFEGWSEVIELRGNEIFLCSFDLKK